MWKLVISSSANCLYTNNKCDIFVQTKAFDDSWLCYWPSRRYVVKVVFSLVSSVLHREHQTSEPGFVPSTCQWHAVIMSGGVRWCREVPEERGLDELTSEELTLCEELTSMKELPCTELSVSMNCVDLTVFINWLSDFRFSKSNSKNGRDASVSMQWCCRKTSNTLIQQLCVDWLLCELCLPKSFRCFFQALSVYL